MYIICQIKKFLKHSSKFSNLSDFDSRKNLVYMAIPTVSRVVWISILLLGMLNTIPYILSARGTQAQAFPIKFKPVKYKFVIAETGDLMAVDRNGTLHGKGDHTKDQVCFFYHRLSKDIVMLESPNGLGYVSMDTHGNVTLATENFSDEEQDEMGSGIMVWYRRFKALYDSDIASTHSRVQLESEELPGCYLSFDDEGIPLNACAHQGLKVTKFLLLRSGC